MVRLRIVLALVAALALSVSLAVSSAGAKSHSCKAVKVHFAGSGTFSYPVKVLKGNVSCKVARSTLKHFIADSTTRRGWACFRGHGSDSWAATCASTSSSQPKRIRAYNP